MGVWGLRVREPASSLFHDEKFAFFDFGVRGTPKMLKICLGVPPQFLTKVGMLSDSAKAFCLRREASRQIEAGAASRRRQKPFAAPDNTPTFLKDWGEPLSIFPKFWGYP